MAQILQDSPKPKAEEPQEPPRVKLVDPFADDLPKADPFAELERSEAHEPWWHVRAYTPSD